MKQLMLIITVIGMSFLSACGRYSAPIPPNDSFYPHPYVVTQE